MLDVLVITLPSCIVIFIVSSTLAYIIPMAFKAFFTSSQQPAAAKSSTGLEEKHQQNTNSTMNHSRFHHDMIAVNALNVSRRRSDDKIKEESVDNSTEGSLNRALDDLDRASSYSDEGKLEQSLTLYQSSLDVLIRAISSSPTNEATTNAITSAQDRIWLKERIKAALTDAEHVKDKLASFKQQQSQQKPLLCSRNPTAMTRTSSSRRSQLIPTTSRANTSISSFPLVTSNSAVVPPPEKEVKKDEMTQLIFSDIYVDSATLTTRWSDVVGLQRAKQALQEAVILPMLRPDLYTNLRSPPRAVLLYGPPGTGKTLIVKAVAYESKCTLFSCSASTLTSKWVGESEKLLRALFQVAGSCAPSIIFVDEIDSLLSKRSESEHEASRRFKTEFMVQMDGCQKDAFSSVAGEATANLVLVIGCTNCPWDIDDAIMRRFQRRIYIPLPDAETRKAVLQSILNKCKPHSLSKQQLMQLVHRTEGYSCSDLTSVGSDAAFGPLRSLGGIEEISKVNPKDVRPVSFDDFLNALQSYPKSISKASLQRYSQWEKELESGTNGSSK
jgi:ATP-dependent 26S proteasome regulatory subunit